MKREVVLSAITVLALSKSMYADTNLGEVLVTTATKTEKSIDGVTASILVITQEEIEKMGAESLKDIINKTAGLTVQYGTFPSASSKSKSSISIRGMSANGTLFLLDGRRLAGEVRNPYDLDRIPASSVERIEIVKGPMSSLYGADATGGIINIITKKPSSTPQIDINLRYGQNSKGNAKNKNASVSIRGTKDKFKYSIYANQTDTTPYTQKEKANVLVKQVGGPNSQTNQKPSNLTPATPSYALSNLNDIYKHDVTYREDSEITTVGGRFDYSLSDNSTIGFDFNFFEEDREGSYIGYFHPSNYKTPLGGKIPVFNIPVDSKDENERLDLGLDFESSLTKDLLLKLRVYNSSYEKRNSTTAVYYKELGYLSKKDSASNGMNANVDVRSYEAMLNYVLNNSHLLTVGTEYREEERDATVFDNTPKMTTKKVDYKSIYLQDEWQITETLNATLGTRYDEVSNADNKATFKIGVVNKFSDLANLRAIFAQGYRTPDLREMYINKQTPNGLQQGAQVVGYDLKPEFTNTYELGLSGRNSNFRYDIALFLNDIEDRISQVQRNGYYTFENINEAQTKGLELNLSYDILNNLSTNFNFMYLKTKDKSTDKDLEFNPDKTASISFSYSPIETLTLSPTLRYIGKQYYSENFKTLTTNSQTFVDFNLDYKIDKNFSLYAGANNIFDEKVDDVLGSNVGVFYFTGLRIKF
ncbi:TonB-dependent receptor plug domain-containing protein [Halarcobacter bivalviorum]|uniref:TonB-dependent receptor n=1 Tax=Halarcobacter bivalviorum TaxID=663364 RepID=A0AAX2AB50_9BACT|nr:TonB-dependent receptor [Halarcobacter bivalviorum]AXH12032.1 TonB-dependent receptor [Halarcobacter bivalviorum]RXK11145.1 TonB-dependent receptor [Halarcobacter bivalviorum]